LDQSVSAWSATTAIREGDSVEVTVTWSGRICLPETTEPLRVVIEEFEPGRQDAAGAVVEVQVAVLVTTVDLPPG
jgi:hypothetical protein